jgi:hypothetical protein
MQKQFNKGTVARIDDIKKSVEKSSLLLSLLLIA